MERENQKTHSSPSQEAPSTGGLSMAPPAMQLMAGTAPIQRVRNSIQDFPIVQIRTSEADLEGTQEFRAFMDPTSTYQTTLHLTRDEARTACLLMVEAFHRGESVDMASRGTEFANPARARLNPAANAGPTTRLSMEIGSLSPQRAQELFNQLATLRFRDANGAQSPIPFHYPPDGCYARAHLMSERMTQLGIESRKQFAVSTRQGGLQVRSDYASDGPQGSQPTVTWWYHVAPILAVDQPNGTTIDMVMDPSMFGTPVPVSSWTGAMRPDAFNVMDVAAVAQHVQANGGRYGAGQNTTYSTDRDDFWPTQHDNVPNPVRSAADMDSVRGTLTTYATNAQSHELAAAMRRALRNPAVDIAPLVAHARTMSMPAKQFFNANFMTLFTEAWNRFSPAQRTEFRAVW